MNDQSGNLPFVMNQDGTVSTMFALQTKWPLHKRFMKKAEPICKQMGFECIFRSVNMGGLARYITLEVRGELSVLPELRLAIKKL